MKMSILANIQLKIQETTEAIARLKQMIKDQPTSPSLCANMKSLENRYRALEADFAVAAKREVEDLRALVGCRDHESLREWVERLKTDLVHLRQEK